MKKAFLQNRFRIGFCNMISLLDIWIFVPFVLYDFAIHEMTFKARFYYSIFFNVLSFLFHMFICPYGNAYLHINIRKCTFRVYSYRKGLSLKSVVLPWIKKDMKKKEKLSFFSYKQSFLWGSKREKKKKNECHEYSENYVNWNKVAGIFIFFLFDRHIIRFSIRKTMPKWPVNIWVHIWANYWPRFFKYVIFDIRPRKKISIFALWIIKSLG